MSNLVIDTSAAATDTIEYVATDQSSLVSAGGYCLRSLPYALNSFTRPARMRAEPATLQEPGTLRTSDRNLKNEAEFNHRALSWSSAMDWNRVEGNWKQVKGKVKEKWGNLTDDDLTAINGKRDQLEGKIQERYGIAKDQARKDVDAWYDAQKW